MISTNNTFTNLISTNNTLTNVVSLYNKTANSITSGSLNNPWYSGNIHLKNSFITNITDSNGVTISAFQLLSSSFIRSNQQNTVTDELPSPTDLINYINIITNTQASVGMNFQTIFVNTGSHVQNINATGTSFQSHVNAITDLSTPNYLFSN